MKTKLCIEVINNAMRCAVLSVPKGGEPRLTGGITFDCVPDISEVEEFNAFRRDFKSQLRERNIKSCEAVMCVHSHKILFKDVVMNAIPEKNIPQYLRTNSADYFPVSVDDCIFDIKIHHKTQSEIKLSVFAVPVSIMESCKDFVGKLGLKFSGISVSGTPVKVRDLQKDSYVSVALLNNTMSVMYVQKGILTYSRQDVLENTDLAYTGAFLRLDDFLLNRYGIGISDIDVYLFGSQRQREYINGILNGAFTVNAPLQDGTDYDVNNEYGYLANQVEAAKNFTKERTSGKGNINFTNSKSGVNRFLPSAIAATAVLIAATLVFNCVIPSNKLKEQEKRLGEVKQKEKTAQQNYEIYKQYLEIKTESDKGVKKAQVYNNDIQTYNNNFPVLIEELAQKMPSDLKITDISVSETAVKINVTTSAMESCLAAMHELELLTYADTSEISSVVNTNGVFSFTVLLTYNDNLLNAEILQGGA